MDHLELKKFLLIGNKNGQKSKERYFIKYLITEYKEIIKYIEKYFNDSNIMTWKEKLYNYLNYITIPHKCKNCDNICKFDINNNKYYEFCSIKCASSASDTLEKRKNTSLIKYGVDNPMKNKIISKKSRDSFNFKIKNDPEFLKKINNKREKTWKLIYNSDNPNRCDLVKNKKKKSCLLKYNSNTNLSTKDNKYKVKNTCMLKYGVDNPMKNIEIKNKVSNNCLVKYNKKRYLFTDEYIKKVKKLNKIKTITIFAKLLKCENKNIEIVDEYILNIKNYCSKHDSFFISKNNIYNRLNYNVENICTICNPISENSSIKENEIRCFINNDLNINTEKNKIKNIINKSNVINNQEIDIYLPKYRLGIEFDGIYHHSDIFKNKNYHLNKTNLCEENNIQLLHIFENEWINKKEIVKSTIKSKLGIFDNKIYARKCEIRVVNNNNLIKDFLENNHLLGYVGSNIKLGLFYDNELISLMIFRKKYISMIDETRINHEYEMLRFCNKINTTVIGGASKLLKYFVKTYNPSTIITFVDRRYDNGNLCKQLGFKFIENTKPNYWYFKSHEYVLYRSLRKLIELPYDSNKTKHQILQERGYYKIYDCGNMKFIYNR